MDARHGFGGFECGGAGRDAVERERCLRGGGNWFLCERMWERFERGIVLEREVRAFVGFDENEDGCGVAHFPAGRDPVRIRESRGLALPVSERRHVIKFACHGVAEMCGGVFVAPASCTRFCVRRAIVKPVGWKAALQKLLGVRN
jgi:hypothetical protein